MPDFSTYAWNQLAPATSPDARWGHAMVWDGSRFVMFGGRDNIVGTVDPTMFDDTWIYDADDWTQLAPATSPPGRWAHSMVWDGSRIIMYGGITGNTVLGDTWKFESGTWTELFPANSPGASWLHKTVWDGSRILFFGGSTGVQTWKYESSNWTNLSPSPNVTTSGAGSSPGLVYDGSETLLFAGKALNSGSSTQTGQTWEYTPNAWTQLSPSNSPIRRTRADMAWADTAAILFGGDTTGSGVLGAIFKDDTWTYDTDWTQLLVSVHPDARALHAMAWDGDRIILFGGQGGTDYGSVSGLFGDTWEFATSVEPEPTVKAINNKFGLG